MVMLIFSTRIGLYLSGVRTAWQRPGACQMEATVEVRSVGHKRDSLNRILLCEICTPLESRMPRALHLDSHSWDLSRACR